MASATNHIDGDDLSKTTYSNGTTTTSPPINFSSLDPSTAAIHADDPLNTVTDVAPPLHVSTTYRYASNPDELFTSEDRISQGKPPREPTENIYSRESTSSGSRLEAILSTLLKGPVLTYSSGLSAFNAILTHLHPSKVAIGDGYHGCHGTLAIYQRLTSCKILPLDCPATDLDEGDLLWLETPVNPTGKAFNIQHYADIAHSRGAWLGIDATFAPPPLQDPFRHGADIIMHSGTKYLGGHSDMLCGVVAIRPSHAKDKDWFTSMAADRVYLGNVMGSLENWLGVRSLRTFDLRIKRQSASCGRIVDALDGALTGATVGTGLSQNDVEVVKKVVREVQHASLQATDLKQGWLQKQMPNGYGPVFAVVMQSEQLAKRLPSKLHLFHHATSLGGVESLIEWRTMSDNTVGRDLLRVSVGCEDDRDLLDDLLQGFRALIEELGL